MNNESNSNNNDNSSLEYLITNGQKIFYFCPTENKDDIVYIPYNLNNILIQEEDIIQILNKYNVNIDKINHIEYFRLAFTHKSYCNKDIYPTDILEKSKKELLANDNNKLLELQNESYDRLEYVGDRVLKLIVSLYLYHRYPNQDEGFMTKLQTKLEDKKNLAYMSKELGLEKFFIISKQIEQTNRKNLERIHEDVFESFMSALFFSNGFEPCMYLITNLLETLIDYSDKLYCDNNYKDILLRLHHQRKWSDPLYKLIKFNGPAHKRKYIMGVEKNNISSLSSNEDIYIGYGIGLSKKEGEQSAAKMALIKYGILEKDQYTSNDIFYPNLNNDFDNENIYDDNTNENIEHIENNNIIENDNNIIIENDNETIELETKLKKKNYKDILLRYHHKNKWDNPIYGLINHEGPNKDNINKYTMGVKDKENKFIGYGIGLSKKDGEQNAAKMALILYGLLKKDQYNSNDIFYPIINENFDTSTIYSQISEKSL